MSKDDKGKPRSAIEENTLRILPAVELKPLPIFESEEEKEKKKIRQERQEQERQESVRRIALFDCYKKKPGTSAYEDFSGEDTFVSYEELGKFAKEGMEFFYPPSSENEGKACLSCGDGRLYLGSLSEIHTQLSNCLAKDPNNKKTLAGLNRITQELKATPEKANLMSQQQEAEPEVTDTAPNPFSKKPRPW